MLRGVLPGVVHYLVDSLSVDGPGIAWRSRERGADEAVALRLRQQREQIFAHERCTELDVERDVDLDDGISAVLVALRHDAMHGAARAHVDTCAPRVVAEAREHAANEPGEEQVLRFPGVLLRDRIAAEIAPERPVAVHRNAVFEPLRARRHAPDTTVRPAD